MLHNKTAQSMVGYVVLNVTFKYGTIEQLNATGREHRDLSGVLFGRTFDVPRERQGRRLMEHDVGHAHGGGRAAADRVDLDG